MTHSDPLKTLLETEVGTTSFYQSQRIVDHHNRLIGGFTGKPLTYGGNDWPRETILENRHALCRALGMNAEHLVFPFQIHSNEIRTTRDRDFHGVDALIVTEPGIPVMVQVADCVPILLYAPDKHIGAVIHAGWRGTAANVCTQVASRLRSEFGVNLAQTTAVIGPAITGPYYEVSEEVAEAVATSLPPETDKALWKKQQGDARPRIDLKTVNRLQLAQEGVTDIETLPYCTAGNNDAFWSYRCGEAGRQILILQLR